MTKLSRRRRFFRHFRFGDFVVVVGVVVVGANAVVVADAVVVVTNAVVDDDVAASVAVVGRHAKSVYFVTFATITWITYRTRIVSTRMIGRSIRCIVGSVVCGAADVIDVAAAAASGNAVTAAIRRRTAAAAVASSSVDPTRVIEVVAFVFTASTSVTTSAISVHVVTWSKLRVLTQDEIVQVGEKLKLSVGKRGGHR